MEENYSCTLIKSSRVKTLVSSMDLFKYMTAFLLNYAEQNNPPSNFNVLPIYFKWDNMLEQILTDYTTLK